MKKYIAILLAFLCLTSCASYRDIKINSVELEKVSVIGAPLGATLAVEIDNPTVTLKFTDISGVIKVSGETALTFTCDPFTLKGHSCQTYHLDLSAALERGFGLSNIVRIIQAQDLDGVTADVSVTAKDPIGVKHTKTRTDIPLFE
jgi:hypothetical protein